MRRGWYIFSDGRTQGPVTVDELLYQVEMNGVGPDALVWRPGFADWIYAEEVEGLFKPPVPPNAQQASVAPPPPPAPSAPISVPDDFEPDHALMPHSAYAREQEPEPAPQSPVREERRSRLRATANRTRATMAALAVPVSFEFRAHERVKDEDDYEAAIGRRRSRRAGLVDRLEAIAQPA